MADAGFMVPCPVCTLRRGPADCRCLEGTLEPPVFDERPVLGRLRRPEPEIAWCSTTIDVIEAYHQFAGTSSTALAPRFSERGGSCDPSRKHGTWLAFVWVRARLR